MGRKKLCKVSYFFIKKVFKINLNEPEALFYVLQHKTS